MNEANFQKDPDATLDFSFDWSQWLATGETISSAVWTVSGVTKVSQTDNATSTTIWLSGGTSGSSYNVACKITTSSGRVDERTMRIAVVER